MRNLSYVGRTFYSLAIIVIGVLTIYYRDFPYMMIPQKHSWIPGLGVLAPVFGVLLLLAGACITFKTNAKSVSLFLGSTLLCIFCFYFIPYQLFVSKNYIVFGDWENAAKELTLASGAFVIAGCFAEIVERPILKLLGKLIPLGTTMYSITIISYSIDHFLYAKESADYVPSWIPYHLFWLYFTGVALFGSGVAIIFNFKRGLTATLLGTMIFTWFIILHIPRMVESPLQYLGSEIASACLALAYSGIALVIAGMKTNKF